MYKLDVVVEVDFPPHLLTLLLSKSDARPDTKVSPKDDPSDILATSRILLVEAC